MPTETQDWYASWFNSPYYPVLYRHRNDEEAKSFIQKLFGFLHPPDSSRILDLACGRGRHAVYIHSLGYDVTGLDLSAESIEYAKTSEEPALQFHVQDMRKDFGKQQYDLVLNLFTSLGYFEEVAEDAQVVQNISNALRPGGTFVLDFMNAEREKANLVKEETKEADGIVFNLRREVKDGCILKHIVFKVNEEEMKFTERVRAYAKAELEAMLREAGLSVTATFGDYDLRPFTPAESPRLVLVAKHSANNW